MTVHRKHRRPPLGVGRSAAIVPMLIAVLILWFAGASRAQGAGGGREIFASLCDGCHTIGGGDLVGPDLAGVQERRSNDWLVQWLVDPIGMVKSGDPIATELLQAYNGLQMPGMGLTREDAQAILAFIASETATPAAIDAADPAALHANATELAGDAHRGKDLFTGVRRLSNGGPACMSCHSIAAMGALGGGAVGPDLTGAASRYGSAAALTSVLGDIPFPTMRPIFNRTPLTDQERADLAAFLAEAEVPARNPDSVTLLFGLGVAGLVILNILLQIIWRHRNRGIRRTLATGGRP